MALAIPRDSVIFRGGQPKQAENGRNATHRTEGKNSD
jgi:hypothetical protein